MEYQGELKSHGLSFHGLHAVLAHLNTHPDRTHLLAVRGPNGIQDFIVTPKRRTQAVAQLRRIVNGHAKRSDHEIRIQTF